MNKEEIENKIKGICQDCMWLEKIEPIINKLQQENQKYKEVIDKAIEILKLCNSQCAKQTIEILKGDSNE